MAASLANAMCENELTALRALNDAGERELPVVGSSLISACFGYLSLRYCHGYTSLDSAINAQPFYNYFINFISGSFSDFTDKSVSFFSEEIFKNRQARIDLIFTAGASAVALWFAALGAQSLAVLGAEELGGEHKEKLFKKLVINIESAVYHYRVFAVILLDGLAAESFFIRHGTLEIHSKATLDGLKASGTFRGIFHLGRNRQTDISTRIGHASFNGCIAEFHTGNLLGNQSIVYRNAMGLSPK